MYLVCEKMLDPKCIFVKRDTKDQSIFLPTLCSYEQQYYVIGFNLVKCLVSCLLRLNCITKEPVDDLEFYIFFDRITGLELLHYVQLGITFDPILVLMLAKLEVTLEDIKKSDFLLYKNMNIDVDIYWIFVLTGQFVLGRGNSSNQKVFEGSCE